MRYMTEREEVIKEMMTQYNRGAHPLIAFGLVLIPILLDIRDCLDNRGR